MKNAAAMPTGGKQAQAAAGAGAGLAQKGQQTGHHKAPGSEMADMGNPHQDLRLEVLTNAKSVTVITAARAARTYTLRTFSEWRCVMTTTNIDLELTEAELARVVGGEVALQHEPLHSSSTSGSAGPRVSIKFSPEYTRH